MYVWSGPRFVAAVLVTCKAFDERKAIDYAAEYCGLVTAESHSF